jgi:hypothetical protein
MKNVTPFSLLFSVCLSILQSAVGVAGVQNEAPPPPPRAVNIRVDSRVELLAVVQFLSGYDKRYRLITRFDFPYKQDVREYFSTYKSHPAVQLFDRMSAEGFSFDAPPTAMLYLSEPPELAVEKPFTEYLNKRAGGEKRLKKFVELLRDFAKETGFVVFFKAHNGTFQQMVANAQKRMGGTNYAQTLQDYYGISQNSYNIILSPLFTGGFGPRIERSDGKYDVYSILGPMNMKDGQPAFGSEESFRHIAWHEFSHSFVNPTTAKFSKEIDKYKTLYEPISGKMKGQAYPDWQTCVNEHIVRAVTTRLTSREISSEAGAQALDREKARGFAYVRALCESLARYEKQRDKYPTFVDFYPELASVFKNLSEKDLGQDFYTIPFKGTINAAVTDRAFAILVVPTNEKDKRVQEKIHSFVGNMQKRFYKGRPILTDKEALQKDLSKNTVVAYGTPKGNLFIAKYIAGIPVRIESDRIVADKVYEGTDLRFITAWPNPRNPEKGMVFYTAQKAESILRINSVFHGPTDYVIAKATELLTSANYNKQNGTWSLIPVIDSGTETEETK